MDWFFWKHYPGVNSLISKMKNYLTLQRPFPSNMRNVERFVLVQKLQSKKKTFWSEKEKEAGLLESRLGSEDLRFEWVSMCTSFLEAKKIQWNSRKIWPEKKQPSEKKNRIFWNCLSEWAKAFPRKKKNTVPML